MNKLTMIMFFLLSTAVSLSATPVTIDFSSGSGNNSSSYQEDGFRLFPEPGDHFENNFNGDGRFSWHDGSANTAPNIITLDRADGSQSPFSVIRVQVLWIVRMVPSLLFPLSGFKLQSLPPTVVIQEELSFLARKQDSK